MKSIRNGKDCIVGIILIAVLMAEAWLFDFFQRRASLMYESQWYLTEWTIASFTEVLLGFILCLWIVPRAWRSRRFSAVYLVLFLVLIGFTIAFRWGFFAPAIVPGSGTIALLNVLAGVILFKGFFVWRRASD